MKLLKFWMCLLVILGSISILIPPTYANLPCEDGDCEDECDCDDDGSGGGGFGGGGGGGFTAGGQIVTIDISDKRYQGSNYRSETSGKSNKSSNGSRVTITTGSLRSSSGNGFAGIGSLMVKMNWGVPANENIPGLAGKFEIYAKMPTASLYTPQMLQYDHVLLNNVGRLVISKTHNLKNSLRGQTGTMVVTSGTPTMRLDQAVVYYDTLPEKVSHRVEFMTKKREVLTFEFSDDNGPIGLPIDNNVNSNYTLRMVNATGALQLNGEFYELHYGNGYFIRYNADNLKVISAHTPTGRVVSAEDDSVGLAATYTEEGYIRQVFSQCEGLADVVVTEPGVSYEVRYYGPEQVTGMSDGLYTVTGDPFTIWRIENPQAGSGSPMPPLMGRSATPETGTTDTVPGPINLQSSKLKVTKMIGDVSEVSLFQYSYNSDGWQLTEPDNLALKSQTSISSGYNERTIETTVKTPTGEVASKTTRKYFNYDFGQRIISEENVAGKAEYRYYTNRNETGSYGRIEGRKYIDGFWEGYQYDEYGRTTRLTSPWKNARFLSSPSECRAIYYSYDPVDSRDPGGNYSHRPRKIEEKILGITTSLTYYAYYYDNDQYVEVEERCPVQNAAYGDASNLKTEHRYYAGGTTNSPSAGRLQQVIRPDGTTDTFTYEYGIWQANSNPAQSVFTGGNGQAIRVKVTQGTIANPNGIAEKTLQTETIYDSRGNKVWQALNYYTGSTYPQLNWIAQTYDNQRRMISSLKSNGELYECTWTCCAKSSETFPDGTEYTYVYDAKKRLISKTKVGIGNIPDLITTNTYDAAGRQTRVTISGGNLSSSSTKTYDTAGRITFTTNHQGQSISYSYDSNINGGISQRQTETRIDGSNIIVDRYNDGQVISITGSAIIPQLFDSGIHSNGYRWSKVSLGNETRYRKNTSNLLGYIDNIEKSGFNGTIVTQNHYNENAQINQISQNDEAKIIFNHDLLGYIIIAGQDIDNDNSLLLNSDQDRIIKLSRTFGPEWFTYTTSFYGTAGSDTSVSSIQLERLSNFSNGLIAESKNIDLHRNQITQKTTINRNSKTKTISTISPHSEIENSHTYTNGLLVSTRDYSNLQTSYSYDGLGRLSSITEPRTGSITYSYYDLEGKKGLIQSITDSQGNSSSFDYDQLGRLILITNALGMTTQYSYNSHNQVIRIWGSSQYPSEFIYDELGQLIIMKTFRANNDTENWPNATDPSDITTWTYDLPSGLLTSKTDPAGKAVHYNYSIDGKVVSRTWARKINDSNIITHYNYDPATNELLNVAYSDTTPHITYEYNRMGMLTKVIDSTGTRLFNYDQEFKLHFESIEGIYNKTLNFSYTNSGQKGKIQGLSIGSTDHYLYDYDNYGRLFQINDFVYSRLANSNMINKISRANDIDTIINYETYQDLISSLSNDSISTFSFNYDEIGRKTSLHRSGSLLANDSINYTYNNRNELISATSNIDENYNYSYSYDSIGNRLNTSHGDKNINYTTNSLNQYNHVNENTINYDDDGNMLTYNGWHLTWNAENQLIKIEKNECLLEFSYDYLGRRIEKKVYDNNVLRKHLRFVYDRYKLLEELDALNNNALLRRYIWQPRTMIFDVPLSVYDSTLDSIFYYHHANTNKNISELTDESGTIVAHYEYDPFGVQTIKSGSYAEINPFRFSSEYFDIETGLIYFNFRYYEPELGRWVNRDPSGEIAGLNLYSMLNNSTTDQWDDLGLSACPKGSSSSDKLKEKVKRMWEQREYKGRGWEDIQNMSDKDKEYYACIIENMGDKASADQIRNTNVYTGKKPGTDHKGQSTGNHFIVDDCMNLQDLIALMVHENIHANSNQAKNQLLIWKEWIDRDSAETSQKEDAARQKFGDLDADPVREIECCNKETGKKQTVTITKMDIIKEGCGGPKANCEGKGKNDVEEE